MSASGPKPEVAKQFESSLRQNIEQRLGFHQIKRVKAFGETTVNRRQKIAGMLRLPLLAPKTR